MDDLQASLRAPSFFALFRAFRGPARFNQRFLGSLLKKRVTQRRQGAKGCCFSGFFATLRLCGIRNPVFQQAVRACTELWLGNGREHQRCANKPAQGNALGLDGNKNKALKGRGKKWGRPFRALSFLLPKPQGCARASLALGWLAPGLWPDGAMKFRTDSKHGDSEMFFFRVLSCLSRALPQTQ